MLWLATPDDQLRWRFIRRFEPRYWTIDFPRPMMAALVTAGADGLDLTLTFHDRDALAGLIWESHDRWSHPLLACETRRDYRGLVLSLRWQADGAVKPLDQLHGPTLTIEGRDAGGAPRTWYVRLWNYAVGTPDDAVITLDFDALAGGYLHPQEADPVWAGDIDRLFISLVPAAFDGVSTGPLPGGPVEALVRLRDLRVDGAGAAIEAGDAWLPPHGVGLAGGYDDSYNQTPERLVEAMMRLGYRGRFDHYVGMSHFPRLHWDAAAGAHRVDAAAPDPLDGACSAWHRDFFARCRAHDLVPIVSLSVELLDALCPDGWKQRDHGGAPAQTGWSPPSTLLSPGVPAAMAWLAAVLGRFCALAAASGGAFEVQIGEPWWWVPVDGARAPFIHDAATMAAYTAATGQPAPAPVTALGQTLSPAQLAYVQWCGARLGAAMLALRDSVRAAHPDVPVSVLIYTPQIVDTAAPWLVDLNLPLAWAAPAFDRLQLEDYGFVTAANWGARAGARALTLERLGYPLAETDLFAGFVLTPAERHQWQAIATALSADRAGHARFLWAYPQIVRDGVVVQGDEEETPMTGFHDVLFPLALGFGSRGGPEFSTSVVETVAGREQRNANWAQARRSWDVATGLRADSDVALLIGFFEARLGRAYGFRFRDPYDASSAAFGAAVTPFDQPLGVGDGQRTRFLLVKQLGVHSRRITRPVAGSVRVAVAGTELTAGWTIDLDTGTLDFAAAPPAGAPVSAGFAFDVPVRFADDRLSVSLEAFRAGEIPAVGLVEIKED